LLPGFNRQLNARKGKRACLQKSTSPYALLSRNIVSHKARVSDGLTERGSHQEEENVLSASYVVSQSNKDIAVQQCSLERVGLDFQSRGAGTAMLLQTQPHMPARRLNCALRRPPAQGANAFID
jgi:hypothetical protein